MKLYLIWPIKDIYTYESTEFIFENRNKFSLCDLNHNFSAKIVNEKLRDIPLLKKVNPNIIFGTLSGVFDYNIINMKLIEILTMDFVVQNFYLGDTYFKGKKVTDFITVFPQEQVRIRFRGNKKSTYRVCEHCGYIMSFAWADKLEDYYVLEGAFNTNFDIFISDFMTLVVSEKMLLKVRHLFEKDYHIKELRILKEPLDGYERDLPW